MNVAVRIKVMIGLMVLEIYQGWRVGTRVACLSHYGAGMEGGACP